MSHGFVVQLNSGGLPTAFVASYGTGAPVVGLVAEYDALAGHSQMATATRKIRAGTHAAHTNGHSLVGTASVAAAIAVKQAWTQQPCTGTLRLYGLPAKETGEGKHTMALAGAFADVDALLAWQPSAVTQSVFEQSQALLAVKFTFQGMPSQETLLTHPETCVIEAANLLNIGVSYLRRHVHDNMRLHHAPVDEGRTPKRA